MPKRILIADDEPTVVALARQTLERAGYIVETADNGKAAWEIVKSVPVDLVVTDVIMPKMDGVDLYKELKKSPATARIPIVIITDNRIFRESFQTLGVEHFLPKPLDGDKLLHKLEYVFTCAELDQQNRQVLILGSDGRINAEMKRILDEHQLVVGASSDPIEFMHNSMIVAPHVVMIDMQIGGDITAPEVVRALRVFNRLKDTEIVLFMQSVPEDVGSMEGIEELRILKNHCMAAGATRYIGSFSPATFWDAVRSLLS